MSRDAAYFNDCEEMERLRAELEHLYAIDKARAALTAELLAALEDLIAEQNGPPLEHPRKKLQWEAAYAAAIIAIKRAKGERMSKRVDWPRAAWGLATAKPRKAKRTK